MNFKYVAPRKVFPLSPKGSGEGRLYDLTHHAEEVSWPFLLGSFSPFLLIEGFRFALCSSLDMVAEFSGCAVSMLHYNPPFSPGFSRH